MKPLADYLVVTIEQAVAAPLCTSRLADSGARVIKIERPGGDFARGYDRAAMGDSSYFAWLNRNKESATVDFKQPDDKALLDALLARADVFVQNLAPGALARAGFGTKSLREKYPKLIVCEISGYGDSPAMAGMKAYDLLIQAESGLVSISGGPNELGRIGVSICDIGAGMTAHAAILEALLRRHETGEGSAVQVSLFDVAAEWMTVPLLHHDHGDGAPKRVGLRHPSIAPYGAYTTSDGQQTVVSIQNEREWRRLCELVLLKPSLADDPDFCSNNQRVKHRDALDSSIAAIVSELDAETFRARMKSASIAFGAVNTVADLSVHPALRRRMVHSTEGKPFSIPAAPFVWKGEAPDDGGRPPLPGEHTERIRREFLTDEKTG